eukprot:TRINITY_DN2016_c0_g1_i2.p2 TRINITY_DN2016_c0_g1~~TRINITY_DN2016_c0_g1_i2.p2  ORF type:complete len:160 (-),score=16.12 TRINITY_DN2016_c0_g1_i2:121-600(-)
MHIRKDLLGQLFKLAIDFNYIANIDEGVREVGGLFFKFVVYFSEFAGGATLEEVLGIQVRAPIQAPATAARDDRNDTRGRTVRKVRSRALRRRIRYQQQRFNYCQSCGKAGVIIECDFCTFSYHRLAPPMPFDYASTAKHMFSCYALWKPRRLYFDFLV